MGSLRAEIRLSHLKDGVLELESSLKKPIRDDNPFLPLICGGIEAVLRQGLKIFGLKKWDYWNWMEALARRLLNDKQRLAYVHGITFVKSFKKINSLQGYGRQFIRFSLMKRLLPYTIQSLIANPSVAKYWYDDTSVFRNKAMKETFIDILKELGKHVFDLDLKNCSFLSESWLIPEIRLVDIVPCKELGLVVRTVNNRVMVASVRANSAAEDVAELLRRNIGRPVSFTLVKGKLRNGKDFPPSSERMAVISADPYKEDLNDFDRAPQQLAGFEETPVHASDTTAIYSAKYYGKVNVGEDGGVGVIEDSVLEVLKQGNEPKAVYLNLSETNIVVTDQETSKVLGVHSFTETSACGQREDCKHLIAFVSGESSCALAKNFYCYVYEMKSERIAKVVLYSIGELRVSRKKFRNSKAVEDQRFVKSTSMEEFKAKTNRLRFEIDQAEVREKAAIKNLTFARHEAEEKEKEADALKRRIQLLEDKLDAVEERIFEKNKLYHEELARLEREDRQIKILNEFEEEDERKMEKLESMIKECKERADYNENKCAECRRRLQIITREIEKFGLRNKAANRKIRELEEQNKYVGRNLRKLEISEEKRCDREDAYDKRMRDLEEMRRDEEIRYEAAERKIAKLQHEASDVRNQLREEEKKIYNVKNMFNETMNGLDRV
ncbi:Tropomyosin [Acropora cervicornis]|uniref:Tropomyosin n=1 Tax=Acropora cervicornis TaxID=6130 RepID=A0AAD9Q9B8_ACRCE|nr:Tropomyosin [Acropora cervicornis]